MKKEYTVPQIKLTVCDVNDIISNSPPSVIEEYQSHAGFIDTIKWY